MLSFIRLFIFISFVFFVCKGTCHAIGNERGIIKSATPYSNLKTPWADSVFNSLTLDQRIAQLFMVAAYSNKDKKHEEEIANLISRYNIGGIIFFQGTPLHQAALTNYFQSLSRTPLVIAMDAEWGLGMRLDSTISFPRQMMLGAAHNPDMIYKMGEEIARELHRMGVQINFAPVVDINNNPDNPVISNRSFGEDRELVSSLSISYMSGLQNHHIFSVAKHFPGHGDTDSDSHFNLPIINQDYKRIDSIELYPFKKLIAANLGGIMIGHLRIPSLDTTAGLPSTLSKKVVNGLLRDSLGFDGLIFTDALNMKGAANAFPTGELEIRALEAGNDILVMSGDVPTAIAKIKQAILDGRISESIINESCHKLLILKEWTGLGHHLMVDSKNLVKDLNTIPSDLLNRKIIESALTLVKDQNNLIPVKQLEKTRIAVVLTGEDINNEFDKTIDLYADNDKYTLSRKAGDTEVNDLVNQLSQYNLIIVGVMGTNFSPGKNYGVSPATMNLLAKIPNGARTILDVFTPPYFLKRIDSLQRYSSIIVSYEDNALTREYSAQMIFGGISARGVLPVTAGQGMEFMQGLKTPPPVRFKYSIPAELNIDEKYISRVDSIVKDAIAKKAFPGCQIFASKNGIVFYHKAFGYQTYDTLRKIQLTDLYDLASVTKVAATLPTMMKLYDEGQFRTYKTLSDYLPELKKTNKSDILLVDVLTHQARLQPFIPFYQHLIEPLADQNKSGALLFKTGEKSKPAYDYMISKKNRYRPGYFSNVASGGYTNQVADSLFILTSFEDTIFNEMDASALLTKKEYKYSDLGFMYLYRISNTLTHLPMQEYVWQNFYAPLGARTTGYWPLLKYEKSQIAPTELDLNYRHQLIQGYVHDPGASLMGGVSGHAGLFSDANDLAKIFQMYLNGGTYGGQRFIQQATLDYFNTAPFIANGNRRGLGFDKPETIPGKPGPTCNCVSASSFGHSGFTGTFVWADPETGLLYVFLSNRVYPSSENNKITDMNIRTKILDALTQGIGRN